MSGDKLTSLSINLTQFGTHLFIIMMIKTFSIMNFGECGFMFELSLTNYQQMKNKFRQPHNWKFVFAPRENVLQHFRRLCWWKYGANLRSKLMINFLSWLHELAGIWKCWKTCRTLANSSLLNCHSVITWQSETRVMHAPKVASSDVSAWCQWRACRLMQLDQNVGQCGWCLRAQCSVAFISH